MTQWRMPHEGDAHERTWMAWPAGGYTLGGTAADADIARDTWAAVANAISRFEPLSMLVTSAESAAARRRLSADIELVDAQLDDAWYRDSGPSFVLATDGSGRLGAVNWTFNGWGQQRWATWALDAEASAVATDGSGAERIDSTLVCEGGAIHTDGVGTVLTTEAVLLDPLRNPGWTRDEVDAELARTIGAERVVWLPRGLTRDTMDYGTKGHVDIVATMPEPGRVLLHDQRDTAHPDAAISADLRAVLEREIDARGRSLEIIALPAPAALRDAEGFVDWSYVNHYVANGAVIACSFDDPADRDAQAILADAYPGREVVAVDARPIFDRGGGIHCITQQQPAV